MKKINQRFEYKYFLPINDYHSIRKDILLFCEYDTYCLDTPDNFYYVKSLYYDTYELDSYHDKLIGVCNRTKYRVRTYTSNSFSNIKIEFKHHHNELYYKEVRGISLKNETLCFNDEFWENNDSIFYSKIKNLNLVPAILIDYKRQAFTDTVTGELRVNIDKDIGYRTGKLSLDQTPEHKISHQGYVLEIKFKQFLPVWAKQIISKYNLQKTSISKYCICTDDSRKTTG